MVSPGENGIKVTPHVDLIEENYLGFRKNTRVLIQERSIALLFSLCQFRVLEI